MPDSERATSTPGAGLFRLCLFGAPLDTGNLGVSALGVSTLAAVADRVREPQIQLFGHTDGVRARRVELPQGPLTIQERGLWLSRRITRPESMYRFFLSNVAGLRGNVVVRLMRSADAVWDISGGDSFSDIYGQRRFFKMALPKLAALKQARQLVLLPQTYGPFQGRLNRRIAHRIVVGAHRVWARDADSFERLSELAGRDFDPTRHRMGVDVAFLLPSVAPSRASETIVARWSAEDRPMVGINVSGLLAASGASSRFGLEFDHDEMLTALVQRFLDRTDVGVLLVPHVLGTGDESDLAACRHLKSRFADRARVQVLEGDGFDAASTKWAISRTAWMAGARMHSTIAALSTMTPVTGIAYSDKMRGVFASCGIEDQVLDARSTGSADAVDVLWAGFEARESIADVLDQHVPVTRATAAEMFDELVSTSVGVGS